MNTSKKIVSLLTATALMCSLTACGGTGSQDTSGTTGSSQDKVYRIGICQLTEHEALDAATEGFQDALKEKLGDKVEFEFHNAQGEEANCTTIASGFVSGNVDLIMANATASLQAASAATNQIPIVATSITDYSVALNIEDWSGTSGSNITGTSDLAPIDQQEDMIVELFPDVKTVGILYCSSEPNSNFQAELMADALEEDNIAYKIYTAADSNEIQSVATTASSECDVIYVPTDNTMASSVETLKNIFIPAKIPMIAGEKGICAAGIATLSIDYYSLGYTTGEMAYEILAEGKDPGSMEIRYAEETTKVYNKENCDAIGFTMSAEGYEALEEE